jgi:hypothetical protein
MNRMLGNCIFRNPITKNDKLDKGAICEALLFFAGAHLVIDMATLDTIVKANFLDDLIEMLKAGYLTGNFSPQTPGLHTDNKGGLREHTFTVIKLSGDQQRPNMRNPELLESQLTRAFKDKAIAKKYHRQLADLLTFKDIGDNGVPELGRKDISDPYIAKEVVRMALRANGIPDEAITFRRFDVVPLDGFKFTVLTDIDFERLSQFVPESARSTFTQNILLPAIADARWDIGTAASKNAAFVGSEKNEPVINMILQRSLGVRFDGDRERRQIYDFISVATPSVREVINNGERTPREFITLLEKAGSFQKWLREQNPEADLVKEMLREKARTSWLESLPIKAMRFGLFTGAGLIADAFAPGSSVSIGAADTFIVEQIGKSWRPHYFVENSLRSFLEGSQA